MLNQIMKKIFLLIIIISCISCVSKPQQSTKLKAFHYSPEDLLPLAPELTKKVLPNGLTYYVRNNGNPGGRATMFLIVNSGSSNETEEQLGYAHFTEHMAFNGTESFPENELVNYLRSIGMDFGAEINAHTTQEETLYKLEMPISDIKNLDTGLKVLKEWASLVSFDPVEVEKEKGVILEEMRASLSSDNTARVNEMNGLLKGSKHENRDPIGTEESIKNASAEKLRQFYEDNYRPDRMAVIVVGDINTQMVSKKIEELFSFPSRDGKVLPRPLFAVEPTQDMGFVATFDKQFERSVLSYRKIVSYNQEIFIKDYIELLKMRMASEAIRLRLNTLTRSGQTEWNDAYFDHDYFFGHSQLYQFVISSSNGKELEAFKSLSTEIERIRRFGFSESEFNRIIDYYTKWLSTLDVEDNDLKSHSFAEEYVRNFMYNEPVPGVINERFYIFDTIKAMTLSELNRYANIILASDEGFVGLRAKDTQSNKNKLTESNFEKILRDSQIAELEPLESTNDDIGFFDGQPDGSKIEKDESINNNILKLTLSNGATVLLKQTDYDLDAISFCAISPGGYSTLPIKDQTTAVLAPTLLSVTGLGSMDAIRLEEITAPLSASIQYSIGETNEIISGKSSTKDLEAMMRLIYLVSTEPGKDGNAFNVAKSNLVEQVSSYLKNPDYVFETTWSKDYFDNNPRLDPLDVKKIASIDFEQTRNIVMSKFAAASDFTYIFVGDFDITNIKSLVAKYIGSIPAGQKDSTSAISPVTIKSKANKNIVEYKLAKEPRASVRLLWGSEIKYNWQLQDSLELFAAALNNRLLDAIREDLGATYVVNTSAVVSKNPVEMFSLVVKFDTNPERVDEIIASIKEEIKTISDGGFSNIYADQIRTQAERSYLGRVYTNDYWISLLVKAITTDQDFNVLSRAAQTSNFSNKENFTNICKTLLTEDNLNIYVMMPE